MSNPKNQDNREDLSSKALGKGEDKGVGRKFGVVFYVILISAIIFIAWLFTLPYVFSTLRKGGGENEGLISEDTKEILFNIKDAFGTFGEKVKEISTPTSTESAINLEIKSTSTQDQAIEKLKEKILEKTNEE